MEPEERLQDDTVLAEGIKNCLKFPDVSSNTPGKKNWDYWVWLVWLFIHTHFQNIPGNSSVMASLKLSLLSLSQTLSSLLLMSTCHPLCTGTGKDRRDLQRWNGWHYHRGGCGDGERWQIPCGTIHTEWRQRHTTGGQPACHWTFPFR